MTFTELLIFIQTDSGLELFSDNPAATVIQAKSVTAAMITLAK